MYVFPPDLKTGKVYDNVKLVLQIDFIDAYKIKITIIYACDKIIKKYQSHHVIHNVPDLDFTIWSFSDFKFHIMEFKLPSKAFYYEGSNYTYDFMYDIRRKNFLKKLYISLNNFSSDNEIFFDKANKSNKGNIVVDNIYWLLK